MSTETKVEKARDKAATPFKLVESIEELIGSTFTLDVAAAHETTKCEEYYTIEENGLEQSWECSSGYAWCNPPYSNVMPWVEKAIEEASIGNFSALLLVNDPSTKWFRRAMESKYLYKVYLLTPRIQFIPPPGIVYSTNPGTGALLVFNDCWADGIEVYDWKNREVLY